MIRGTLNSYVLKRPKIGIVTAVRKTSNTSRTEEKKVVATPRVISLGPKRGTKKISKNKDVIKKKAMNLPVPSMVIKKATFKDLSRGKLKVASGLVRDAGGRVLNGTVTIKKGTLVIGKSKTAAGSYRIFDLSPGTYVFEFESLGGKKATHTVKVEKDKNVSINFQFK